MPPAIRRRKALGQHHLRSGASCRPAIDFLQPEGRVVVEIGPGGGALTRELIAAGASVVGWELDLRWAAELRRRLAGPSLRIVAGDALHLPWERLGPSTLVAGNLPYAVATPILDAFLLRGQAVTRAVFLVQDEVARRLVAEPATRPYGYLTVITAALASVTVLARVPPGSFVPAPKVYGAFVGVERREPVVPLAEMNGFRVSVSAAFGHRRKTIANSLAQTFGRGRAAGALQAAGIEPGRRAETLSLPELVALHRALAVDVEQKNLLEC